MGFGKVDFNLLDEPGFNLGSGSVTWSAARIRPAKRRCTTASDRRSAAKSWTPANRKWRIWALRVREGRGKTICGSKGRFFPHLPDKSLILRKSRTISSESRLSMSYVDKSVKNFSSRFSPRCEKPGSESRGLGRTEWRDSSRGKLTRISDFLPEIVRLCEPFALRRLNQKHL